MEPLIMHWLPKCEILLLFLMRCSLELLLPSDKDVAPMCGMHVPQNLFAVLTADTSFLLPLSSVFCPQVALDILSAVTTHLHVSLESLCMNPHSLCPCFARPHSSETSPQNSMSFGCSHILSEKYGWSYSSAGEPCPTMQKALGSVPANTHTPQKTKLSW